MNPAKLMMRQEISAMPSILLPSIQLIEFAYVIWRALIPLVR